MPVQAKAEPRIRLKSGASRSDPTGKGRFDLISPYALERLALHYEAGAKLHGDRNWEKGIPFSRLIDSAERHLNKFKQRKADEDNLAAAMWQLCGLMHFQAVGPRSLDDRPRYRKEGAK